MNVQGSGRSGGDYVTLGAHEVNDLGVAVAYLRERFPVCTIGLWGRSMGAVTALLYSQKDPSIAGIVSLTCPALDSACFGIRGSSGAHVNGLSNSNPHMDSLVCVIVLTVASCTF